MKIEFTPQAAFSICGISNKRKGSIIMKKALIAMSGGVDSSVATADAAKRICMHRRHNETF